MNPIRLFVCGGALISTFALAQGTSVYDGTWSATFPDKAGGEREAALELQGTSGTWLLYPRGGKGKDRKDPCQGRPFAVTVQSSSPTKMKLSIDEADTILGCGDRNVTLTPIDEKNLQGQFGDGRVLKLVRK